MYQHFGFWLFVICSLKGWKVCAETRSCKGAISKSCIQPSQGGKEYNTVYVLRPYIPRSSQCCYTSSCKCCYTVNSAFDTCLKYIRLFLVLHVWKWRGSCKVGQSLSIAITLSSTQTLFNYLSLAPVLVTLWIMDAKMMKQC